jgi:membrane fusion protein, heavy metal efflux system
MTPPRYSVSPLVAILVTVVMLATGAAAMYFFQRHGRPTTAVAPALSSSPPPAPSSPPRPATGTAVVISLTADAIERSGIKVAKVTTGTTSRRLRIPGAVEPNAYRQVAVTPLAGGRITSVPVALGDRVRRGHTLAEIYSPELAEAQTQYVALSADLEVAHQQLTRTERLVEIGSASRQELERIRAEHTTHETHVASARSKLVLLGLTPEQISRLESAHAISATVPVPAPIDGTITERLANAGLNVDPGTKMFTVVDLSTVWIVGNVYERDFAKVRVGSPAAITVTAFPGLALNGRVTYIDPQVNRETRTAQVRVEIPNPRTQLRIGMYAELQIEDASGSSVLTVPKTAIQIVDNRQVVYVAVPDPPGRFIEREVRLGAASADQVEVLSGLGADDSVVVEGSFFLRAERDRLGLGGPVSTPSASAGGDVVRMTVTEKGFEPSQLQVRMGVPTRLIVTRMADKTCATEIVFESLEIRRDLPLNQPVEILFTPKAAGDIAFTCGMNMLRGTIVAK